MKVKFDDTIKYVRVQSIDEMDFENLPEEYLRQLAKGIVRLLSKNVHSADNTEQE